uniref:Carboxypeptidase n=1 Tax=Rhabditophanes sp. KR3021 TaxID=114890 RepID=A0AC35U516_9BILA
MGPFYVNADGTTLYENVFAWNRYANVLYLESPIGTGFSYSKKNVFYSDANDDQTLSQNYKALTDFFTNVQPQYKDRPFFIGAESYGGITAPMLADKIIQGINDGSFPNKNFQGMSIGNGYMDIPLIENTLVLWSEYHGRFSLDEWAAIKKDCCANGDVDNCDFYQHFKSATQLDFSPDDTACGKHFSSIIGKEVDPSLDPYNFYQDCYGGSAITYFDKKPRRRMQTQPSTAAVADPKNNPFARYPLGGNTADFINRDSTDNQFGYPCLQENYVTQYFNNEDNQKAWNIDSSFKKANRTFADCNDALYNKYKVKYTNQDTQFASIIKNNMNPNFTILVYNGDIDTVCNYLGDSKFIDKVYKAFQATKPKTAPTVSSRDRWIYRTMTAGWVQSYQLSNVKIDVLTVKGAGHLVPLSRPGPVYQMITNFMQHSPSYSETNMEVTPTPNPLLSTTTKGAAGGIFTYISCFATLFVISIFTYINAL